MIVETHFSSRQSIINDSFNAITIYAARLDILIRYTTKQPDDALFRGSGCDMADCVWG
jgi:hypothetical protein